MACKYWYDGKWRSEKEFKQILENGLAERPRSGSWRPGKGWSQGPGSTCGRL